jgi:hypothetical protein
MEVGDLVLFASDKTIGVVVEVRKNSDVVCLFEGQIYLVAQQSLEVIDEGR